jgi:hypothetical protein
MEDKTIEEVQEQNAIQVTNDLIDSGRFINAEHYINSIKLAIKEGHVDALKAYTVIKRMAKIADEVKDDAYVKECAMTVLERHLSGNQKSVSLYGAKIIKAATYTYYDFSGCGHDVLDELYHIKKTVDMHIKAFEDELKKTIPPESKQVSVEFGIESTTTKFELREFPKLTWEGYGVVKDVHFPKKIQKMGMKFMQI